MLSDYEFLRSFLLQINCFQRNIPCNHQAVGREILYDDPGSPFSPHLQHDLLNDLFGTCCISRNPESNPQQVVF